MYIYISERGIYVIGFSYPVVPKGKTCICASLIKHMREWHDIMDALQEVLGAILGFDTVISNNLKCIKLFIKYVY